MGRLGRTLIGVVALTAACGKSTSKSDHHGDSGGTDPSGGSDAGGSDTGGSAGRGGSVSAGAPNAGEGGAPSGGTGTSGGAGAAATGGGGEGGDAPCGETLGGATLESQSGVEALRNVGTITGALIIRGSVEDLSPLRCLTNGPLELRIVETDRLTSLRGLEGIRSLDGNPGALERNLVIQANSVLTNLDGLSGLTRVGGDITLRDNDALVDVSGLGSLSDLGGGLSIVSNPKLEHIVGLESITRATDVTIMTNDALATIEGLGGLQEVGSLRIDLNPLLESVNGLESLVWVEDALYLWDNPIVTTLAPLANLTTARRLLLNRMHGLESLAGLENAGIQYEVNIQRNEGLVTTRGLRLAPAGVRPLEIQVRDNPRLTSLEGFSGVAGTIALFHVEANEALETLQGLEGIASATSIMVSSNPALRTLEGLDGLTTVTDSVTITSNESLTSLEALDSLSAGSLVVFANPALTSLSGLESLRSAVILNIGDNATLRSLRALAGVEAVERFTVWSNVLLPTCEAYWLRDTIGVENIGYWTISGNDDAGTCP